MVVEGALFGKTGNFIIDTGSENLILNQVHFNTNLKLGSKQVSGVLGNAGVLANKNVSDFQLKEILVSKINADVVNLSNIEKSKNFRLLGIIGYRVLKNYEVFIDLHLNQLTLWKIDKRGEKLEHRKFLEQISDSIPFTLKKHTIVLNSSIENKKMKLGLDSGAEYNQINKRWAKKLNNNFNGFRRMFVLGVGNKKSEVLVGKLEKVVLNDRIYLEWMNTILIDFNGMYEAYGTMLDGVLGYEFFRQKRTIINYKKRMLYFVDFPE